MSIKPTQKLRQIPLKDFDLNRVAQITTSNVAMMTIMYSALTEISRSELSVNAERKVSLTGELDKKAIAETALVEIHKIAKSLSKTEVANAKV